MDRYMKDIPSAVMWPDGENGEVLWEYSNTRSEKIKVARKYFELSDKNGIRRLAIDEVDSIELDDNWKQSEAARVLKFHLNDQTFDFLVDTTRGTFVDAITVLRQIQRHLISHRSATR